LRAIDVAIQKLVGFAVAAGQQIRQGILGRFGRAWYVGLTLSVRFSTVVLVMTERPGKDGAGRRFLKGL
jgi:hypothetical protein